MPNFRLRTLILVAVVYLSLTGLITQTVSVVLLLSAVGIVVALLWRRPQMLAASIPDGALALRWAATLRVFAPGLLLMLAGAAFAGLSPDIRARVFGGLAALEAVVIVSLQAWAVRHPQRELSDLPVFALLGRPSVSRAVRARLIVVVLHLAALASLVAAAAV